MFSRFGKWFDSRLGSGRRKIDAKYTVLQSALVFASLSLILMLYGFFGGIIVASLGASSFIAFVTPHTNGSRNYNLIGGYVCGAVSGVLFSLLHSALGMLAIEAIGILAGSGIFEGIDFALVFGCAAASALTTFMMVWSGCVHPPSAALALGLAADRNALITATAAIGGIIIVCAVRYLLRNHTKNLV
jgi:CBS-domain-containing membrane protein